MKTKIEWTDITWNPVWGCDGGCKYCYAKGIANRFAKQIAKTHFGKYSKEYEQKVADLKAFKPTVLPYKLSMLFPQKPKKIFVNSMSDIAFWDKETQLYVIGRMCAAETHTFQILTKFPEKIQYLDFPNNVWLGVTVENQTAADKRIPKLLKIKAGKLFVSLEPLQSAVSFMNIRQYDSENKHIASYQVLKEITGCRDSNRKAIDWVIIGGQTGHNAKPMHINWVRNIINDCERFNVPVFFKSWGAYIPLKESDTVKNTIEFADTGHIFENADFTTFNALNIHYMKKTTKNMVKNEVNGKIYNQFPIK